MLPTKKRRGRPPGKKAARAAKRRGRPAIPKASKIAEGAERMALWFAVYLKVKAICADLSKHERDAIAKVLVREP